MLSPAQQGLAQEYIKMAAVDGIFVGALLGEQDWDVRPLVLDRSGASRIVRFSAPEIAQDLDFVKEMFCQLPNYLPNLETGVVENRVYQIRPFYQSTLADISFFQRSTLGMLPSDLLFSLFEDCVKWRHKGFVHGHLSLSNIAIKSGQICLFDFAFAALERDGELAPELLNGAKFGTTAAADIYGLGRIAEAVLGDNLSADQQELVAAMQSRTPNNRPSLLDAAGILFPNKNLTSRNSVMSLQFGEDTSLKLGKVLGTNLGVGKVEDKQEPQSPHSELQSDAKVVTKGSSEDKQTSLWGFVILLLIVAGAYYYNQSQYEEVAPIEEVANYEDNFEEKWQSSIPSMMKPVAEAAVSGNLKARLLILKDVLNGAVKPNVQSDFLKVAFDPSWEQELNEQDRDFIFHFALLKFVGGGKLPKFEELHPGVLYALIATLPSVNDRIAKLDDFTVDKFTRLPGPYGQIFKLIGQHKVTSPYVKAVSRLLIGKAEPETLIAFLTGISDQKEFVNRISLLKQLLHDPYSTEEILTGVTRVNGWAAEQLKWLSESSVFDSESLSDVFKFSFLLGSFTPNTEFTLEQCADLLRLKDNNEVTALAAALLRKKYFKDDNRETIMVLLSSKIKLTRKQVIDFLSTISLEKKFQSKLFSHWFETKPNQDDVMMLVAARHNFELDPFSLMAVDYLKGKDWNVSTSDLTKLVVHKEALVRILAYSKLDPANPIHIKLLIAGLKNDPVPNIRKRIEEKLSDYGIRP